MCWTCMCLQAAPFSLELFHAPDPIGPWVPHSLNPVFVGDPSSGARMAGRLVVSDGTLYRFGQDCGRMYGHKIVAFRIDELTTTGYNETRVQLDYKKLGSGFATWNGVRAHHIDAQQVSAEK